MSVMRRAVLQAASQLEHLPDQGVWRQRFCFAADSAVFAGHFPGHPVLPAVVQVLMVQVILEAIGQPADLACIPQAKFLAPVGPAMDILLTLSKGRRNNRWACTLHCGEILAARMQVEVPAP
ncbi:MAG: hypothetical protein F8N36_07025 [Desulfovibrio sp.]|uniref:hypothetical protein n=1 Tax=Desulfovibrio sp. TaxID=885 RepID=UPI00135E66E7|nr:hypothetical protein [Desulfovibrio sp.]MTJ92603.1 hypothetical protein [Desulfovibrio sp.]